MSHFALQILSLLKYKYSPVKILFAYFGTSHSIFLNKRILNFLNLLNTLSCVYMFYICMYLYIIHTHILYLCIFWGIFFKLVFWDSCFRCILWGLAHLLHCYSSPRLSVFLFLFVLKLIFLFSYYFFHFIFYNIFIELIHIPLNLPFKVYNSKVFSIFIVVQTW